jgi:hypothetical protein
MLGTESMLASAAQPMPGSKHLQSWLAAITEVRTHCPDLDCEIDFRRYRLLQAGFVFRTIYLGGRVPPFPLRAFWAAFPPLERWLYRSSFAVASSLVRLARGPLRSMLVRLIKAVGRRAVKESQWSEAEHSPYNYRSLREVFDRVDPASFMRRADRDV